MKVWDSKAGTACHIDICEIIGGDEALAFVAMALTMYQRWAARHGFMSEVIAREPSWVKDGFHQRIRLRIEGADPAVLGARENGVHGLARVVAATGRRHMAFIGVRVSDRPDMPWPDRRDAWGEQIRCLVLDPEPAALNRLTGGHSNRPADVLDGHLELIWDVAS